MMRERNTFYNIATNIFLQIVLATSGFIIPKIILETYGSDINGMVASISQFLVYVALVEMGIANAAIVALYKPIASNNYSSISDIFASVGKMYRTSGVIYTVISVLLTCTYPLVIGNQIEYTFAAGMVFILSLVGIIDYFWLSKYKVLLIAQQKYYVVNNTKSVATVVTLIGSIFLLMYGQSVLLVKMLLVISHIGESIFISFYVRRQYSEINFKSSNYVVIKQRWNAMVHQVSTVIVYNTDIVVFTLFSPSKSLKEISVYSVYAMTHSLINNFIGVLTTGINVLFGDMFAKNEIKKAQENYNKYEYVYYILLFTAYTCFAVLIQPFIGLYTRDITDTNYLRMNIGILFAVMGITAQIKDVSLVIVNAAGRYKETQRYAMSEAIINIIISILLIQKMGMAGVLLGTIISHVYMDFKIMNYVAQNLLLNTAGLTIRRVVRNSFAAVLLVVIELQFVEMSYDWMLWIVQAIIIVVINIIIFLLINILYERDNCKSIIDKFIRKNNQ